MIADTTALAEAIKAGKFSASEVLQASLEAAHRPFAGPPVEFQVEGRRQPWFPLAGVAA